MIAVSSGQSEDSPVSSLEELAGHQVSVHSEQAAVSVADQGGLLEVLGGGQELGLGLGGGEAGDQGQQQEGRDGGDGGELEC